MRGTDFGGIHSFHDLNLIQQKVEVDPAEPKLNLIEIPGADGAVDLTEQPAGRVTYNTRKITWTFALYPGENWDAKHRQVNNALNGRRCNITLGTDQEYYYQGRLSVSKHNIDGLLRQIVVEAICQPYKLRQKQTSVFVPFSGKNLINPTYLEDPSNFYPNDAVYISIPIVLKPNTNYVLSCDEVTQPTTQIVLNIGTGPWESTSKPNILRTVFNLRTRRTTRTVVQFTTGDAALYYFQYYMNGVKRDAWTVDEWLTRMCTNLQLEEGSFSSSYEAFVEVGTGADGVALTLLNDRRPTTPTITCQANTWLYFEGASIRLNAGVHKVLGLQLEEGENEVTLESTGPVAITYQEGSL